MNIKTASNPWILGGMAIAGGYITLRSLRTAWQGRKLKGKVVLITGGSKGLGMILARDFVQQRSQVVICARNEEELQKAKAWIAKETGVSVLTVVCDVSQRADVDRMIGTVLEEYGNIDILVNNAGTISVAPIEATTLEDFARSQNTMFWGTLYPIYAVLPHMRQKRQGNIVNITSIGGLIGVPHLIPYSAAKFATVGLSQGLHAELKQHGITVSTILPGLMRTGSFINAEFKGPKDQEYGWFSLAASLPLLSMSAERASRQIVDAVISGDGFRILGVSAKIGASIYTLFPHFSLAALSAINRLLPQASPETQLDQSVSPGKDLRKPREARPLRLMKGLGHSAIEHYQT